MRTNPMEIGRGWTDRSLTHFAPASAPLRQGSGRGGVGQGERRSGLFCVHDELANQPKDVISSIGRSWGGGNRGEKSFVGLACAGRPRPMINIPTELLRTFVAALVFQGFTQCGVTALVHAHCVAAPDQLIAATYPVQPPLQD